MHKFLQLSPTCRLFLLCRLLARGDDIIRRGVLGLAQMLASPLLLPLGNGEAAQEGVSAQQGRGREGWVGIRQRSAQEVSALRLPVCLQVQNWNPQRVTPLTLCHILLLTAPPQRADGGGDASG